MAGLALLGVWRTEVEPDFAGQGLLNDENPDYLMERGDGIH
jgi:hypothetical protein